MNGKYDDIDLKIIPFLKENFTYVFHIRKFRNEIKNKVSNIEYLLMTNQLIAKFQLPIAADEMELFEFLEINEKEKVIKQGSYYSQVRKDRCQ